MLKVTIADIFDNVTTVYANTLKEALSYAESHPKLIAHSDFGFYLKVLAYH